MTLKTNENRKKINIQFNLKPKPVNNNNPQLCQTIEHYRNCIIRLLCVNEHRLLSKHISICSRDKTVVKHTNKTFCIPQTNKNNRAQV